VTGVQTCALPISKGYHAEDGFLCEESLHVEGRGLLGGKLYESGMFSVQDESSLLAVNMLDPQPGETVIDVCAAPGGKTLAIAEKMRNKGTVFAWDIYKRKLDIVDREAKRLGVNIVTSKTWDATRVDSSMIEKADRVLVDAPCSGLGVIRRKPEIKYKKKTREIDELPKKQLEILSASSKYVKPGGTLVYSTCSISPYENQQVVREFLKKNKNFFVKEEEIQLLPNVNNTDGFFICKMKRDECLICE
jgi:16S rRNA (cytosine967-C5)-methyltransferase